MHASSGLFENRGISTLRIVVVHVYSIRQFRARQCISRRSGGKKCPPSFANTLPINHFSNRRVCLKQKTFKISVSPVRIFRDRNWTDRMSNDGVSIPFTHAVRHTSGAWWTIHATLRPYGDWKDEKFSVRRKRNGRRTSPTGFGRTVYFRRHSTVTRSPTTKKQIRGNNPITGDMNFEFRTIAKRANGAGPQGFYDDRKHFTFPFSG